MRWDELFDDLEAQFGEAETAELAGEVTDRSRRELSLLRLVDRLRPVIGQPRDVAARRRRRDRGRTHRRSVLTGCCSPKLVAAKRSSPRTRSCGSAGSPLKPRFRTEREQVAARLDLAYALRGIVRDRSAVALTLIDGSTAAGTLDRVGADFVEVAEHAPGEPRRHDAVRAVRAYPLTSLVVVRRA